MACMLNRKPFRTKEQKAIARRTATKVRGTYHSAAPVSYHDRCVCGRKAAEADGCKGR